MQATSSRVWKINQLGYTKITNLAGNTPSFMHNKLLNYPTKIYEGD